MARGTARPRDRFDEVPVDLTRVGAHRAPARRASVLVAFAWAALATGVLVGVGVLGLSAIERTVTAPDGTTSSAAAQPAATVDPKASVVVLNATETGGLAAGAAKQAKAAGWTVTSTANADVQNVKVSTVYYGTKSQLGAALGLAKSLGIERTPQLSSRFDVAGQSRLTVVLGSDFSAAS